MFEASDFKFLDDRGERYFSLFDHILIIARYYVNNRDKDESIWEYTVFEDVDYLNDISSEFSTSDMRKDIANRFNHLSDFVKQFFIQAVLEAEIDTGYLKLQKH